jgi:hypothetical protein
MGNYAGGSTAVCGLLMLMGTFMGDELEPNCLEDLELRRKPVKKIKKVIAKRNKNHARWGWKDPQVTLRAKQVVPLLKNPYLVCIFRDPYAKACTEMKRSADHWYKQAEVCNETNWRIMNFVNNHDYPYHLISYEHLMRCKAREVKRLAKFLGYRIQNEKDLNRITGFLRPQDTADLTNLEYVRNNSV